MFCDTTVFRWQLDFQWEWALWAVAFVTVFSQSERLRCDCVINPAPTNSYIGSTLPVHRLSSMNYVIDSMCSIAAKLMNCNCQWTLCSCAIDSMCLTWCSFRGFQFSAMKKWFKVKIISNCNTTESRAKGFWTKWNYVILSKCLLLTRMKLLCK